MASPQLEQGFIRLAHELDAALSVAGFGRVEALILREVRAQWFGKANREVAWLNFRELERETGIPRQSFQRAVRSLVESRVLAKVEGGHKFIKDYESWILKGQPMLTPELVSYCRSATRRACVSAHEGGQRTRCPGGSADDALGAAHALPFGAAHTMPPSSAAHRNGRAEFETRERKKEGESTHTHDSISDEDTKNRTAIESSAAVHNRKIGEGLMVRLLELLDKHVENGHTRSAVLGAVDMAMQKARDLAAIPAYAAEVLSRPIVEPSPPVVIKSEKGRSRVRAGSIPDDEFLKRMEANLSTIEDA